MRPASRATEPLNSSMISSPSAIMPLNGLARLSASGFPDNLEHLLQAFDLAFGLVLVLQEGRLALQGTVPRVPFSAALSGSAFLRNICP